MIPKIYGYAVAYAPKSKTVCFGLNININEAGEIRAVEAKRAQWIERDTLGLDGVS